MILAPYHNPPYKSPRPNNTNPPQQQQQQPPSSSQSPGKRKRSDSTDSVPVIPATPSPLRIDTVTRVQNEESEPSSPRTKVAEKLENLRIVRGESPAKKLKWRETPKDVKAFGEVGETPQRPTSPSPGIANTPISPRVVIPASETAMAIDTPLPHPDEDLDLTALTWQDEEITGHEIDPTGDDDGEGINGIGFKPTSAMAYARNQKRKQQVNEWKAREAREARQKRLEKRRGGSGGAEGGKGRVVRFAEG